MKDCDRAWWLSWHSPMVLGPLELHSPWWISGYAGDDAIMVAAVRAPTADEAVDVVRFGYDCPDAYIDWRFVRELTGAPFSERFAQAPWMAWTDEATCACRACVGPQVHQARDEALASH